MKLDAHRNRILNAVEARQALLCGANLERAILDDREEVDLYCAATERLQLQPYHLLLTNTESKTTEEYHQENSDIWFMPDKYIGIDVHEYLLSRCKSEAEKKRIEVEYNLFVQHELIPLLRYLIFLVDFMRENKIVWGVGRGSSVASYALYLIGVHKINSLQYNLAIEEFLK